MRLTSSGTAAKSGSKIMASAADRFNINSQLEHLQSRYVGTGHADTNRFEWAVNIHRDSYASYFGHHTMLQYFAVAENESIGRVKYNMMQVRGVGVPVVGGGDLREGSGALARARAG
jgi:splicing factor 3B subunit 5